jgi:nucleoside 2-deoxyribosyltransferase
MKLYLAGPDVFRPDAAQWAASARAQCAAAGHEALVPLDDQAATAAAIYANNLRLIAAADCVLANLDPFRGAEPDSGTCVEIGYALALGKRVIGYAADLRPLRDRLAAADADGVCRDAAGWKIEDFGLPLNLMLAVPLRLARGGLADALRELERA